MIRLWMQLVRLLRAPVREMTIPHLAHDLPGDGTMPPGTWEAGEDVVPGLWTAWFN